MLKKHFRKHTFVLCFIYFCRKFLIGNPVVIVALRWLSIHVLYLLGLINCVPIFSRFFLTIRNCNSNSFIIGNKYAQMCACIGYRHCCWSRRRRLIFFPFGNYRYFPNAAAPVYVRINWRFTTNEYESNYNSHYQQQQQQLQRRLYVGSICRAGN